MAGKGKKKKKNSVEAVAWVESVFGLRDSVLIGVCNAFRTAQFPSYGCCSCGIAGSVVLRLGAGELLEG